MKPHLSGSKDLKCYRPHRKPWKGTFFFFFPYQLVQYNGDETKNKAKTKLGRLMLPIFFKLVADEDKQFNKLQILDTKSLFFLT